MTDFVITVPVVVLGLTLGMTYGLLSVGLVLIYRTNRIINFAHGQIGAFAAAFFGVAAVQWGVPYWLAFGLALIVAAATGSAAEAGVVRRLRNAPRLMSIVATLGVGQVLIAFALVLNSQASAGTSYPQPAGLPSFHIGALLVTPAYTGMLVLSPIVVIAIAAFLRYSRYGLAVRAAANNPEAAMMSGINSGRMSTLAWAIAGALSGFAAILTAPTMGFNNVENFGPALLLRAMTGAALARMNSLPIALIGGIGLGVLQQVLLYNYRDAGLVELALFAIILCALLLQRHRGGREEEKGSWATVQAWRPVPEALRKVWLVRHLGTMTGLTFLVGLALLPVVIDNTASVKMVGIIGFVIVGLSIGMLTGLGGQLTLGQFAVASIGALVSYLVSWKTDSFVLGVFYAGCASAAVSVAVGLPALKLRGTMLTVTTLAFALVTPAWLLRQDWTLGEAVDPGRPVVFGHVLLKGREYYYFAFALFVIALLLTRNLRQSGFARLLVAIRDNEDAARSFTVRATSVKVKGYMLAGFIAGIGGAAYSHSLSRISASSYPAQASIDIVSMTVIGGISLLSGPILGAVFVLGIPTFLPLDSVGIAATKFGALLLIMYLPSGLGQLALPLRDRIVKAIARRRGIDVDAAYEAVGNPDASARGEHSEGLPAAGAPVVARRPGTGSRVLLQAHDLRKQFGGVHAVNGVTFEVRRGETLGLIGPNGAGKTTTFELLGGFTSVDSGRVVFDGRDVTRLGPEARAKRGLIRSFQDAALFPTMTVTECVQLALERVAPTDIFSSVIGWQRAERAKSTRARELVSFMGLERYRDRQVRELSTGTRRITELACLVALEPTLLLLDEPSSGIAQRETEALGQLLLDLKAQLGLTLVVIEHDIPLIMSISDRILAMADGRIIAAGTPEEVKADPGVIEAYLGGSITAIERSGPVALVPQPAAPVGVGAR